MIRNVFAATAVAVMAGTIFAADYCFPSSAIPGGKKAADVKQFVSFIWDDNGYSGEVGTAYEYKTGTIEWKDRANVGGKDDNGTTKNPLNINEGGMGLSWAVKTLGGKLKGGKMTFNMISGLYVPTWGAKWYNRTSEYGSYNNGRVTEDGGADWIVAAANGREQQILDKQGGTQTQKPYMIDGINKLKSAGHELGNHTIDHIETNSPYPKTIFDKFGFGEAFDDGSSKTDALGNPFDEAKEFGTEGAALTMGWKNLAGKALSQKGWEGVVKAGEEPSTKYAKTSTMYGFRAPRLEVNSNLFFALKAKNYLYDCGLEEGYELNVDGKNFLWPYTTDNGNPNVWTQKLNGEKLYIDSMPAGLWQYPVNVMIVPENLRDAVWKNYDIIQRATGVTDHETMADFHSHGKVTGFDFNMFILFGMTGSNALETLKNTLKLRMDGNKAPMHVGCHTDYFTPIYDYATLMSDFNKDKYGLVISNNWNTWVDRKKCWEEFAVHATGVGAVFASGKEVIDAVKGYVGTGPASKNPYSGMTWTFLDNESAPEKSVPSSTLITGDLNNVSVKIPSGTSNYPTFYTNEWAVPGQFKGLTHISLDYKTNTALSLQLFVDGDKPWEVLLNNLNKDVNSGNIPIEAFHYNEYNPGTNTSIDLSKVRGIAIRPLTTGKEALDAQFTVKNIQLAGAKVIPVGIKNLVTANNSFIKMNGINANTLNLSVGTAGIYTVQIFTANGRLVRSIDNQNLAAGQNSVKLNALPSGIYMMKISTQNKSQVLKAVVM